MRDIIESTIEELLTECVFNITGLMSRIKGRSQTSGLHVQVAKECVLWYDYLRPDVINLPKEQLETYDKTVNKAKRFFEYVS